MKKVLLISLVVLMIPLAAWSYSDYTANAYMETVDLDTTTTFESITFPEKSRDLTLHNPAHSGDVWVSISSPSVVSVPTTSDVLGRFLLTPGDTITFRNFATEGISFIRGDKDVSNVSVISTW